MCSDSHVKLLPMAAKCSAHNTLDTSIERFSFDPTSYCSQARIAIIRFRNVGQEDRGYSSEQCVSHDVPK